MKRIKIDWDALRYSIANKLFAVELDQAYHDGLREGATYTMHKIGMEMQRDIELTKTQKQGYDIAVQRFRMIEDSVKERLGIQK